MNTHVYSFFLSVYSETRYHLWGEALRGGTKNGCCRLDWLMYVSFAYFKLLQANY